MSDPEPLSDEWFEREAYECRASDFGIDCELAFRSVAARALEWAAGNPDFREVGVIAMTRRGLLSKADEIRRGM